MELVLAALLVSPGEVSVHLCAGKECPTPSYVSKISFMVGSGVNGV